MKEITKDEVKLLEDFFNALDSNYDLGIGDIFNIDFVELLNEMGYTIKE